MAGDWIKVRSNIKDDPDVVLMAGNLDLDEFAVVGRLHAVWAWLDQHSTTGTNVRITSAYLDRLTACPGFADAMRAVDWLRGRDGDLEFPDFDRHNGESAKRRATETKRKREQRDKRPTECGTNVPHGVPPEAGPEKRREEVKKRESAGAGQSSSKPPAGDPKAICDAYPRREKTAEALSIVAKHLADGEDFEAMLAGTRACAAVIRTLPSGHLNRYVPSAEAFFHNKRWKDDPETLRRQGSQATGQAKIADDEIDRMLGRRANPNPEET